ncbi:hypothetical protein [Acinetobacter sp. TUM15071]|uniref:hypothetical protein n=1 Tax=Acinetobacter sp. TUM15071 TaxID=2609135 RepID=UPI00124BEFF8|nr:hypothetical protein [Acinetobacter sp. TUM15071]
MGYANCTIVSFQDYTLQHVINENNGWGLEREKYDQICAMLKEKNLGLHITQTDMISRSASVVATTVKVYPIEIQKKYGRYILSASGYSSIDTNIERTSEVLDHLKYDSVNNALNRIGIDGKVWKEVLDQVDFVRKHVK